MSIPLILCHSPYWEGVHMTFFFFACVICLSVRLSVCPSVANLCPLYNYSIPVRISKKNLALVFTTMRRCLEPKSHWPWLKLTLAQFEGRTIGFKGHLLTVQYLNGFSDKLGQCSPHKGDGQGAQIIDLGSRSRSDLGLKGHSGKHKA